MESSVYTPCPMQSPRSAPWLAHAALFMVSALFGGNYVVAKFAFREVEPLTLLAIRIGGTAALLGLSLGIRGLARSPAQRAAVVDVPFMRREYGELFLYSLLGISINQACFLEGLSRSSATNAGIIFVGVPVITLAAAVVLGRERATFFGTAGIFTGLAGALVLILPRGGATLSAEAFTGNMFLVTGATVYSFYLVLSKPILARHDPLKVVTWIFALAALTVLPFSLPGLIALSHTGVTSSGALAVAYTVVGATTIPYFLNLWALARVPSSIAAVYILIQPIMAGVLGHFFFGEQLGATAAIAAGLIVVGVGMAVWRPAAR